MFSRQHVAQGALRELLDRWIEHASGTEQVARHEHAVIHKPYLIGIDVNFIGAGIRGIRKLAGSPFRAKHRPAETCPVCLYVRAGEGDVVAELGLQKLIQELDPPPPRPDV